MPLLFGCKELQSGMRLAEAFVYRGRVMIPGNKVLTSSDIGVLQRTYPDTSLRISDPVLDALADFEDDSGDREVAQVAAQKVASCVAETQQRFAQQTSLASVNFNSVRDAAGEVMDYIGRNPVSAALIDRSVDPNSPLAGHTGNVFYLSVVLGTAVRDYVMRERQRQTSASHLSATIAMNLLPLGLGAMFMDVGMYELQHLFAAGYTLTDADRAALHQHPIKGADLLPDTLPAGTKMVVRSHHENFDGSGYPDGQAGEKMHVFTRIVRLCDAFIAATSPRAHRAAKTPARTLWEMCRGPYRKCYDPELTKVFTGLIQPFPVGAKIRLRDGRYAVVVKYNRVDPFLPTAIIAFNEAGERLAEGQVKGPLIVGGGDLPLGSFDGEDLSFLKDLRDASERRPTKRQIESLVDAAYP
jgi:HD-GYP domain-containing protein (c-di-GMP phosphodiesterase class II)